MGIIAPLPQIAAVNRRTVGFLLFLFSGYVSSIHICCTSPGIQYVITKKKERKKSECHPWDEKRSEWHGIICATM